jgi:CheY-like chemotaxis protein
METRRHQLDVELPQKPIHLRADPVRLSQVLSNLLNNAAKYTEAGGHIRLAAKPQDGSVEISVIDNGMGIPPETLPKIFQMFTQGDGSIERAQGGLGVGLALTKRLIELHGGRITARSEGPGRGATFVVQLPTIEGPAAAPAQPDHSPAAAKSGQALRILLVDDNVDFVTSLALLLEESGHEVRVAHDAGAALEAAATLRPEVAFLDLGLPGVSGYELARRLRESSAAAETVLVALSGWGQPQDRARSKSAGFSRHLVKPVEFEQILSVLDTLETEA